MRNARPFKLPLFLAGLALAACFSANKPVDSTQTGNPPVIDSMRVALQVTSGSVRVVGEPGAVMPGGATVEITNLDSGAVERIKAAADGSFEVSVDGSPNAAFSVRARAGGETSSAVYVVRGTAAVGDGQDGALSCMQRASLAGDLLELAGGDAARSCMTDADCVAVRQSASCYPRCEYSVVNRASATQLEQAVSEIEAGLCSGGSCRVDPEGCGRAPVVACLMQTCVDTNPDPTPPPASCNQLQLQAGARLDEAIDAADTSCMSDSDCALASTRIDCLDQCPSSSVPLARSAGSAFAAALATINDTQCAQYAAAGCMPPFISGCDPIDLGRLTCDAGKCVQKPDSPVPDCVTCFESTTEWGYRGGFGPEWTTSRLESCARYVRTRHTFSGEVLDSCEAELIACSSILSTGAVTTALNHNDVRQALARSPGMPVTFGVDPRPMDGQIFRMRIGMQELLVGQACPPTSSSCLPIPAGVRDLKDLLEQIDLLESNMGSCTVFDR